MAPLKIPKPSNKKLTIAANLSNLLPTGTVLAFQGLMPSFTNNGSCITAHKVLTSSASISLSLVCFFSCFTDSFIANGKLYYGIATLNGLYIFNRNKNDDADDDVNDNNKVPNERDGDNRAQRIEEGVINKNKKDDADDDVNDNNKVPNERDGDNRDQRIEEGVINKNKKDDADDEKEILAKYKIRFIDFVHAFCSWLVFMVYAMCSSDVMRCFYPHPSANVNVLVLNLPLAVGGAVSFLFMLFPTKRRGIGSSTTMENYFEQNRRRTIARYGLQVSMKCLKPLALYKELLKKKSIHSQVCACALGCVRSGQRNCSAFKSFA